MDFETMCSILSSIGILAILWRYSKISRENKQLRQNNENLQTQLIEALNKNLEKQDNFNTDPVN